MGYLQNNLKAYRLIFIFENNLRRFIKTELEKSLGQNWFNMIDSGIQEESNQQKQDMIQYLTTSLMDNNPLNYTLLSSLRNIVYEKWNNGLSSFFSNVNKNTNTIKPMVNSKLLEIEKQRNFLNHNNLTDDIYLTQLEANINFFKTYIPRYDEVIYSTIPNRNSLIIGEILKKIIDRINTRENIPFIQIEQANKFLDEELSKLLSEYNRIPKTRDRRKTVTAFINDHCLLQKLSLVKGGN